MASMTDILENKLIDWFFRGQALGLNGASAGVGSGPTTLYIGLLTAAPTDSAPGTEVPSTNAYARVAVPSSLANWSGTQGAGTTTSSTGTSGTTTNNILLTYAAPTGSGWGTAVSAAIYDAATGGNMAAHSPLAVAKTINAGDSITFPAGSIAFQPDN